MSINSIRGNWDAIRRYKHAFKNCIHVLYKIDYTRDERIMVILKDGREFLIECVSLTNSSLALTTKNPYISDVETTKSKLTFLYKNHILSFE